MQETQFNSRVRKLPWRRDRLPTLVFMGFPGGSHGKESAYRAGDMGSIPGLKTPWRRAWQHTLAWRIPMDRGGRWARVHGVTKSLTQLND